MDILKYLFVIFSLCGLSIGLVSTALKIGSGATTSSNGAWIAACVCLEVVGILLSLVALGAMKGPD